MHRNSRIYALSRFDYFGRPYRPCHRLGSVIYTSSSWCKFQSRAQTVLCVTSDWPLFNFTLQNAAAAVLHDVRLISADCSETHSADLKHTHKTALSWLLIKMSRRRPLEIRTFHRWAVQNQKYGRMSTVVAKTRRHSEPPRSFEVRVQECGSGAMLPVGSRAKPLMGVWGKPPMLTTLFVKICYSEPV